MSDWKTKCHRRHVCEQACATCAPLLVDRTGDDEAACAYLIATRETAQWQRLLQALGPHLQDTMPAEDFAELVVAYGAECAAAALRAARSAA